jgi:CoA:oxalate CoA-transferase
MMRPLEGVRVLDLSRVVAGPFAGRMLSDLGADVVKVEPPDGDLSRFWGEERNGVTGFYQQQNAGKRNVCVDMRADGAVELIVRLTAVADIVLENYRAGVMDRMGIGWPVLSAANPRLIMASISGFGQGGPESDRPAFAPVIEAEAGMIARQAAFDNALPTDPMLSIADYNAGLHALVGMLAALHAVKSTGVGTHLDIAMLDTLLATDDYIHHSIDNSPVVRLGGEYRKLPSGRWVLVSGQFKHVWAQLSTFKLVADPAPKGADLDTKIAMRKAAVDNWWAAFVDDAEALGALDRAQIAWGIMKTPDEALASPTAHHRGIVVQVDDRGGSTRGVINSPYRFSAYESGVAGPARHRGEDNESVLTEWLGVSADELLGLQSTGVVVRSETI